MLQMSRREFGQVYIQDMKLFSDRHVISVTFSTLNLNLWKTNSLQSFDVLIFGSKAQWWHFFKRVYSGCMHPTPTCIHVAIHEQKCYTQVTVTYMRSKYPADGIYITEGNMTLVQLQSEILTTNNHTGLCPYVFGLVLYKTPDQTRAS